MQLLAVFMQLDTRTLLMNYIDLRQTKDVQLTFDALLVRKKTTNYVKKPVDFDPSCYIHPQSCHDWGWM